MYVHAYIYARTYIHTYIQPYLKGQSVSVVAHVVAQGRTAGVRQKEAWQAQRVPPRAAHAAAARARARARPRDQRVRRHARMLPGRLLHPSALAWTPGTVAGRVVAQQPRDGRAR